MCYGPARPSGDAREAQALKLTTMGVGMGLDNPHTGVLTWRVLGQYKP